MSARAHSRWCRLHVLLLSGRCPPRWLLHAAPDDALFTRSFVICGTFRGDAEYLQRIFASHREITSKSRCVPSLHSALRKEAPFPMLSSRWHASEAECMATGRLAPYHLTVGEGL